MTLHEERYIEPRQQLPESLNRLIHEMPQDYNDWPQPVPYLFADPVENTSTLPEDDGDVIVGIRNAILMSIPIWAGILLVWWWL